MVSVPAKTTLSSCGFVFSELKSVAVAIASLYVTEKPHCDGIANPKDPEGGSWLDPLAGPYPFEFEWRMRCHRGLDRRLPFDYFDDDLTLDILVGDVCTANIKICDVGFRRSPSTAEARPKECNNKAKNMNAETRLAESVNIKLNKPSAASIASSIDRRTITKFRACRSGAWLSLFLAGPPHGG
ncbi:uncharacterized protein CLUP02_12154 [Colletotrichum lupini]|uniref:Uncharacterized protein n=1 Tax=Colletotrichum lupini TaxID=145971 RepID=A0A9Q8T013_9PEZI|nr:uncharacterized protein CLUP02_12154 [Colletotrichum lupini]UQC86652.1 hypothetical protein CLUP02_12154 [Colletotrichum lupini]